MLGGWAACPGFSPDPNPDENVAADVHADATRHAPGGASGGHAGRRGVASSGGAIVAWCGPCAIDSYGDLAADPPDADAVAAAYAGASYPYAVPDAMADGR
ncbi:MAG: hypothetical protein Kow0047_01740 [Anaerolineae bacterium]